MKLVYPDRDLHMDLIRVNAQINRLPYKADPPEVDDWTPITEAGDDCDSYMTAKLVELLRLGWPIEALRLACCYVEPSAAPEREHRYHAVLAVDMPDGGQMVLDNRHERPVPLGALVAGGYELDCIQKMGGSGSWVRWKTNLN